MRILWCVALSILVATTLFATPGFGSLTITKTSQPEIYDVDWTGCTFTQALRGLHEKLDQHSFAQVLDDRVLPESESKFNQQPDNYISLGIGFRFSRDSMQLGSTRVFYPFWLIGLGKGREMIAGQLIASLTPQQIALHKSEGYIPFGDLTGSQQETCTFLARNFIASAQYPEPELSKRLQESGLVIALQPQMNYEYDYIGGDGKLQKMNTDSYCDRDAMEDLYTKYGPGQIKAGQMTAQAMANPGSDVPGDSTMHALDGTYTLADLLKMVQTGINQIRTEVDPKTILIEAHCDMTGASIARACAVATGMDWHREETGWYLSPDSVYANLKAFGPSTDSSGFMREYERVLPTIRKIAYDGNMVFVADSVWHENFDLRKILDGAEVTWDILTPGQREYLRVSAKMTMDAGGAVPAYDLVASLPRLKLRWQPSLSVYLMTKDSILYREWLRFRPLFPPEEEKAFLSQKSGKPMMAE